MSMEGGLNELFAGGLVGVECGEGVGVGVGLRSE